MKRRSVNVPFCEEHKNHWTWRYLFTGLGLGVIALIFVGGVMVMASSGRSGEDVGFAIMGLALVALIGWAIASAVVWFVGINPSEITDYTITLRNVHNDWVRAYHEQGRGFGADVDDAARAHFRRPGGPPLRRGPRRGPADDAYERG